MGTIYKEVEVEINADDLLDKCTTYELEQELIRRRTSNRHIGASEHRNEFEKLYYAIRDNDINAIFDASAPNLERECGPISF